jgi:hypothetical protein
LIEPAQHGHYDKRALAELESIQKIDKAHKLGKKLEALLQKGAPK